VNGGNHGCQKAIGCDCRYAVRISRTAGIAQREFSSGIMKLVDLGRLAVRAGREEHVARVDCRCGWGRGWRRCVESVTLNGARSGT